MGCEFTTILVGYWGFAKPLLAGPFFTRGLECRISGLDIRPSPAKNTPIPADHAQGTAKAGIYDFIPPSMTPSGSTPPPEKSTTAAPCKHPRVRIVAREEDAEFVECLECSEVFESSEFKDMSIEEGNTEEI